MAIIKISALPAATAATTADLMPIVQGGVTKRLSFGSLMGSPSLFGTGMATFLATPSSANLNAALTTKTGTGLAVFDTSPTLASPTVTAPTVSGGNLTFSGTAQRITGDFSNATVGNRLLFQTSTVNGNTSVAAIPNGTSVQSNLRAFNNSDPTNASFADIGVDATVGAFVRSDRTGTGTYLPLLFNTGGSERVRIDTSGNVGIGTASAGERLNVNSAGAEYAIQWNSTGSNNWVLASATNRAYIANKSTPAEVLTILNGGNVGIGTASPGYTLDINAASGTFRVRNSTGGNDVAITNIAGPVSLIGSTGATAIAFGTNATERMRITATGNIVAGASAALATTATDGFLYVPTCAGVPTGTPTAITGMAPIVVDTTNNRWYFYSGGAWRNAGP